MSVVKPCYLYYITNVVQESVSSEANDLDIVLSCNISNIIFISVIIIIILSAN